MSEIDFSHMPCIYWSNTTKLEYLQRRIIIYSIMYYEQGESCVDDMTFDTISKQLVRLMKKCTKEECKASRYFYVMKDFDGSTGFDLFGKLNKNDKQYLSDLATGIHKIWREEYGKKR